MLPPHLQHTSLVHAYLFVSVTPLAIAVGSLLLRKPISGGEVAGTLLGVAGAAVLTLGPKGDHREVWQRSCKCCTSIFPASVLAAAGPALDLGSLVTDQTWPAYITKLCAAGCCAVVGRRHVAELHAATVKLQATVIGDLVTLIGAISIIGYLEIGQNLRSFMPLMVYAVPVTGAAELT